MATWTKLLIEADEKNYKKLEEVYKIQGIVAAKEIKAEGNASSTPEALFNSMNDYILDGMPCDRVDEIIQNNENEIRWKKRICVHKEIWAREDVDVNQFYNLRDLWIKAFVNTLNDEFQYIKNDDGSFSIKK